MDALIAALDRRSSLRDADALRLRRLKMEHRRVGHHRDEVI
jgi:hypothetical protein